MKVGRQSNDVQPSARTGGTWSLLAALFALSALAALPACTDIPAAPAPAPGTAVPIPSILAMPAKSNPLAGDPTLLPAWRDATWLELVPAMNENRTVPLTRVACLYDAERLYVAFAGADGGKSSTTTSVWLDTSVAQNGTNVIEIVAEAVPPTTAALKSSVWHRCVVPPDANVTPNFSHPMSHFPHAIKGLRVEAGRTTIKGQAGWTVVYAIPLAGLPEPLRKAPDPGKSAWRVQLMRHDTALDSPDPARPEVVQSNLSPVLSGAQLVMPYRMSPLTLSTGSTPAVAARPVGAPAAP